MPATSITSAPRFFSSKANFSQIKKWLLPAAFLLSFSLFAAPAAGQVTIFTPYEEGSFQSIPYAVTFTTAQTGLSASNFSVTGTVTGAYVSSVTGSGTSWSVTVTIPNSFQSAGALSLEMVNSTGVSPGVTGLPYTGNYAQIVLFPLTGTLSLTSTNANPGYAKTGDNINYTLTSDNYPMPTWSATIAGVYASGEANSTTASGNVTLGSGTAQGAISYSWTYFTPDNTNAYGSGTSSIIFDNIAPTASISAPPANIVAGTGTSSVAYTVTYADANFNSSNLTASGITLNTTGTATGTVSINGGNTSYVVVISNISGNGTLGISVGAGHATDKAGNSDAGAGPSATVSVLPNSSPSISYAGPQVYPTNTAISPLTPTSAVGMTAFGASPIASSGLALDYNGNAYTIFSTGNIGLFPPGNGVPPPVPSGNNAGSTNLAVAAISAATSTLIFGNGANIYAMDYTGGTFQAPVDVVAGQASGNLVAATHPASGPEIAMIVKSLSSQISFLTRTAGVWSSPVVITNANTTTALAINTYQGGLKMAYIGADNNLYYATYSGGAWSAVAAWATPNISMSGAGGFALDTQGNVWYSIGTSLAPAQPALLP